MTIDQELQLHNGVNNAVPVVDHRCTTTTTKRQLPPSTQEPLSKKLNLHGFTRIPLPFSSPPISPDISKIQVPTPSPVTELPACASPSDGTVSINAQTTNFTMLNKMKQILREVSQRCDELVDDDEEEDQKKAKDDVESRTEESISVEKTGDGFIIKLDCSCGKDYQILLSKEAKIYYKL